MRMIIVEIELTCKAKTSLYCRVIINRTTLLESVLLLYGISSMLNPYHTVNRDKSNQRRLTYSANRYRLHKCHPPQCIAPALPNPARPYPSTPSG